MLGVRTGGRKSAFCLASTACPIMLCFSCWASPQAPSSERLQPTSLNHFWLCPQSVRGASPLPVLYLLLLGFWGQSYSKRWYGGHFYCTPSLVATALLAHHDILPSEEL